MTTFWSRFANEPDSIRTAGRRTHLREVVVPTGGETPSLWMMDIAAMAAQYPSVAAALKQAGLTPHEHDAYRVALVSAKVTATLAPDGDDRQSPTIFHVDPSSVEGKNVAFLDEHADALEALEATGMWSIQ